MYEMIPPHGSGPFCLFVFIFDFSFSFRNLFQKERKKNLFFFQKKGDTSTCFYLVEPGGRKKYILHQNVYLHVLFPPSSPMQCMNF